MLDPGHGGRDPGAVGNGLKEKDVNLEICKLTAYRLSFYEVEVILTRISDADLSLEERCNIANKIRADCFCSIHANAGGGTGFESYVYLNVPEKTENLRNAVHDTVARYYKNAGFVDRGKKRANFFVLRKTIMPAVLLENLFLDNCSDAEKLKDGSFLDGLAGAIAEGLAAALGMPLRPRQPQEVTGKTLVKAAPAVKPAQARSFLADKNPLAPDYVDIYVLMGARYGIRWDAVFAQSCKETAYWRFGGHVKPEQNNFAGLATFDGKPGASFATPAEGIEAQFQHWHVYYYGGELPAGTRKLDPRRDAVIKAGWAGTLQYVEDLGGRWSQSKEYGYSIVNNFLKPMLAVQAGETAPLPSQTPEPTEAPVPAPTQAPEPAEPADPTPAPTETHEPAQDPPQGPATAPSPEPAQPPAASWDPAGEIARLKADGLINSCHRPEDPVTWGEMATVINRLRKNLPL